MQGLDFHKQYAKTDKFREAAIHFQKQGVYTNAKPNSREWKKFWVMQQERCISGFKTSDGDYITGFNYFYLNFCPIYRVQIVKEKGGKKFTHKRVTDFPSFYSYDAIYFNYIEACQEAGKHAVILKARRKGYSLKNASMLCRNYYFVPESKGYVFATDKKFLTGDGVLNKAWNFMSFIDTHTPFAKKRQVKNTDMHRRASFLIKDAYGNSIEDGYKSEIMGFSLKSNPDKLRGIVASLIFFEEGGSFAELEDAFNIARPSVEQDSFVTGLICVYGTASMNNESMQSISRMFQNPDSYNLLAVPNIWDEGASKMSVGFFHPYYENLDGIDKETGDRLYMDKDGNTLRDKAIAYIMDEREKVVERAVSDSNIDAYVIERPIRPSEALATYGSSIFPKKMLQEHLMRLRTDEEYQDLRQVGHMAIGSDKKIKFVRHRADDSIKTYFLRNSEDKSGAVVVWEHPEPEPPFGLYIIGVDSYDFDASQTNSLGSCLVFKRFANFETYNDMIVAEYTGRPPMAEDFYETVRRLALYYNAKVMYENNNKGIYTYFVNKHCEYMLAEQPDIIDRIVEQSFVKRGKGVHVTKDIRNAMNGWIREYLLEEYSDGKRNINRIFSEPLIEELISWNDKSNFDRVAALGCVMVMRQQMWLSEVKSTEETSKIQQLLEVPIFSEAFYNQYPQTSTEWRIFRN
ncbi:conserved hypothetical protein [Azobacteroides phage ProJPt-Bp1]|uniref:Terminase n=1 Tax=Azobacteroides phage ProJPt-Bp1 TaxID=1920526 RepID=A0A1V1FS86_9CAUD|nr:terminase large subunit [Azobacteroides phage ProJPt-Bp1]BAX03425.1 conserved hypothetical protein [Azobacteroides phage ProJPt-Bp1]